MGRVTCFLEIEGPAVFTYSYYCILSYPTYLWHVQQIVPIFVSIFYSCIASSIICPSLNVTLPHSIQIEPLLTGGHHWHSQQPNTATGASSFCSPTTPLPGFSSLVWNHFQQCPGLLNPNLNHSLPPASHHRSSPLASLTLSTMTSPLSTIVSRSTSGDGWAWSLSLVVAAAGFPRELW